MTPAAQNDQRLLGRPRLAVITRSPLPAITRPQLALVALLALAGSLAMLWLQPWNVTLSDWGTESRVPLNDLLHGHVIGFLGLAPPYGPSLVMRAPFALLASFAGGSARLVYRFSALPCLLALGGLAVWIAPQLRRGGAGWFAVALTVVVCVANPLTYYALLIGHPEEILGGVLCVVAVLTAMRGHATWAGLLLGAAIANKDWALVAIGPVLFALPAHRLRALVIAGVVAGALLGPIALVSYDLKIASARISANDTGGIFYTQQLWWFFGTPGHWVPAMRGQIIQGFRLPPPWLQGRAHLLIVWIGLPLTLIALARRTPRESALLLLVMLLLLRCMLDPWDLIYYPIPFVIALLSWETTVKRRAPVGALAASLAAWAIFEYLPAHLSANQQALSFIVPSIVALAVIAAGVYRRRDGAATRAFAERSHSTTSNSLVKWLSRRAPSASTTTRSSIRTPSVPGR
jgi:hypothetical protein